MIRRCIKKRQNPLYKLKSPNKFLQNYVDVKYHKKLKLYITNDLHDLNLDERHTWGYTYKALGCGIWIYNQIRNGSIDYKSLILQIINNGGDADTNAAVAGSIIGSFAGYKKLPKKWLDKLIHKKWLDEKIILFYQKLL